MVRPLLAKRIDELEQIFKSSGADLRTLEALESELAHRSTPRATSLLRAVRRNLSRPTAETKLRQPNLFETRGSTEVAVTTKERTGPRVDPLTTLTTAPMEHMSASSEAHPHPAPLGEAISLGARGLQNNAGMSPEEASKILRVTLDSDWETIERSRREIVQKSHPDRVNSLPPERRQTLIENARRANEAAKTLLASRVLGR